MSREPRIIVVMPIGPEIHHQRYFDFALASIAGEVSGIIVVCDGWVPARDDARLAGATVHPFVVPWRVGAGAAFNIGMGLVPVGDFGLMMGADDWLAPYCIAEAHRAILDTPPEDRDRTWYILPLRYEGGPSDGKVQALPVNAAVVSRRYWDWCGGFPPEATNTAPDHILTNALMAHDQLRTRVVGDGRPLYHYRDHDMTNTRIGTPHDLIAPLRAWFEKRWKPRG